MYKVVAVSDRPATARRGHDGDSGVASEQQLPEFEQALTELEAVVERLEQGDLPLEEALRVFERGVELTRYCQNSLKTAQQRVEILMKRNGSPEVEPFAAPDGSDPASAATE